LGDQSSGCSVKVTVNQVEKEFGAISVHAFHHECFHDILSVIFFRAAVKHAPDPVDLISGIVMRFEVLFG